MTTLTEQNIDGAAAKCLRNQLGMSQPQFWEAVGVAQSVGSRYEAGAHAIPESVRILIVATHVAGVKIDAKTADGVREMGKLANIQTAKREANAAVGDARRAISAASARLDKVSSGG